MSSGGLTRRSKTSIGPPSTRGPQIAYSTSIRCRVTRRPLSPSLAVVGLGAGEEPDEVVEPERLELLRIIGIGAVDDLAEAADIGHVDLRQAGIRIEGGQTVDVRDVAEHDRVVLAAAVEEVRAVARLPEEHVIARAAEGTVVVGRARVGPADLDVPPAVAKDRVAAEQADLNIDPPGADQDVAVLLALIGGDALRLHERIVVVVVVGADLLRRARRAEPRSGGDGQGEDHR